MKYLLAILVTLNMVPAQTHEPQAQVHIHPLYRIQEAIDQKENKSNKAVEHNKQIIKEILNNDR